MSNFKDLVRIGKDAVVRYAGDADKPVTGFTAAFDCGWGDKKTTVWLDCSAWGERYKKLADYLLKGTLVLVEGNLGTREHDGKTYITLEVTEIKLTGKGESKPRNENKGGGGSTPPSRNDDPFPTDDIPF